MSYVRWSSTNVVGKASRIYLETGPSVLEGSGGAKRNKLKDYDINVWKAALCKAETHAAPLLDVDVRRKGFAKLLSTVFLFNENFDKKACL